MRKPWEWLLAGNALLVLGLFCFTWNYEGQRISKKNTRRIKPGMTLNEVEAILGPPRDELKGRAVVFWPPLYWRLERADGVQPLWKEWIGKSAAIAILVYPDSEYVLDSTSGTPLIRNPGWSEKLEAHWDEWIGR
jgi:hypothetical protein